MKLSAQRNAKIVGTLGPASATVETITGLISAGLNIARVNMSHGTHEGHAKVISNIREASKAAGKEIGILLDLQGPKIRVDKLPKELILENDDLWVIGQTKDMKKYPEYKDCFIPTIYDKLVEDCNVGERVLFDDGLVVAQAIEKDRDLLKIKVLVGGKLKSNKGINLPDTNVSAPSFTAKDKEDLEFGLTQDIDYIALSFVRTKYDILDVKKILEKNKKLLPIISKIEKPQALDNIEEILEVTDSIMIARGDMAVEVGNHLVPRIQKDLIKKCNDRGIPVITATQMLESMAEHPTPTRAEANDVANAVWDGTDAVMLSGETAAGQYPIDAVSMMSQIIIEAEKTPKERPYLRDMDLTTMSASLMVSASSIAEKIEAKKILAITETGHSCLEMTRFRSITPVLGVTNSLTVIRKMCLYWGITPFLIENFSEDRETIETEVIEAVRKECSLKKGDKIVIARGAGSFFKRGSSNSVRVQMV